MLSRLFLITGFLISASQLYAQVRITQPFSRETTPPPPDYSRYDAWASLPFTRDCADTSAGAGICRDLQPFTIADVFFVHPTTYTRHPVGPYLWNADVYDSVINRDTDEKPIRYQASLFNAAGRIYAPRYRQAHYFSYFTPDKVSADSAFEIAYADVRRAFLYYLETYNKGRPLILASHSQGSTHTIRLLQEFFDGKPLDSLLICAYLVGMPVYDTMYSSLKPCQSAGETGCYCSWQTYARGYFPKGYVKPYRYQVCTNPLSWTTDAVYMPASSNKGGVLRDMQTIIPGICDAQIMDGVVRIRKPHIRGRLFIRIKNYHIGDYNLFYMNVRENAIQRVEVFTGESLRMK